MKADVMVGVTKICDSNKYKMSVARRNERERRRVQNVNRTFDTLRHHVQGYKNANKKMSKVETLRCAAEYIRELQTILGLGCSDEEHSLSRADSPMSATIFDYQMPVTPNSQPDSVTQTTFDFSQQTFDSPKSKIASSPLRSPAPMETPDPRPKSASPVSCGSILATCLQMPSIASCDAVVKQEPDGSPTDAFDLNGNSTISTASDGTDNILDEQSYNKLAAALQHHGPQLNLSLCGNCKY